MTKIFILTLKPLIFYTNEEEYVFNEYKKKISCIVKIEKIEDGINLHIELNQASKNIFYLFGFDAYHIRCIFFRYSLEIPKQFLNIKNKPEILLAGTPLELYHKDDNLMFLKRINLIKSIKHHETRGYNLGLFFRETTLPKKDLLNLMALYDRYNLYRTCCTKFERSKDAKKIYDAILLKKNKTYNIPFGSDNYDISKNLSSDMIIVKIPSFYTKEDKKLFFEWINKLISVTKKYHIKNALYLYFENSKKDDLNRIIIPADDHKNLKSIFFRYNISNYEEISKVTPCQIYYHYN